MAINKLRKETNTSNYSRLAKIALATITIFNRKRAGDIHYLTVENYIKGNCGNEHKDILKSLNNEERELVKSFTRIETRGKKRWESPHFALPGYARDDRAVVKESRINVKD